MQCHLLSTASTASTVVTTSAYNLLTCCVCYLELASHVNDGVLVGEAYNRWFCCAICPLFRLSECPDISAHSELRGPEVFLLGARPSREYIGSIDALVGISEPGSRCPFSAASHLLRRTPLRRRLYGSCRSQ